MARIKEEFVNPFLAPAIFVWERELRQPLKLVGAHATDAQHTTEDLTVIIGVTGRLKGNVLYEFSEATARAIAGAMMGSPVDQLDEMALSAIGELANIITGNATIQLAAAGYSCDISPPVILQPKGLEIRATTGIQINVRFDSALGPVGIRVGLSEAEAPAAITG